MSKWNDWLLAAWAIFVMIAYFGGSAGVFNSPYDGPIVPWIGAHTEVLAAGYGVMLLISVATAAFSFIRRPSQQSKSE